MDPSVFSLVDIILVNMDDSANSIMIINLNDQFNDKFLLILLRTLYVIDREHSDILTSARTFLQYAADVRGNESRGANRREIDSYSVGERRSER